jgi:hypothetical protein
MKCASCPTSGEPSVCLGESVPRLCVLARTRADYRQQLARVAREAHTTARPCTAELSDVLAAVAACPDRGGILAASLQPECGCSELTECLAGRGAIPGQVSLQDCLSCAVRRLG